MTLVVQIPADVRSAYRLPSRELVGEPVERTQLALRLQGRPSRRPSPRCLACGQEQVRGGYCDGCDPSDDAVDVWLPLDRIATADDPSHLPDLDGDQRSREPVHVSVSDGLVRIRSRFEDRHRCKSVPGGRWEPNRKEWRYPATPATADRIAVAFDGVPVEADEGFERLREQARARERSAHHRFDFDLPDVPDSATRAWMHQRQAFWFARDLEACLLAMGMGCLTGDTLVNVTKNTQAMTMRLDELVRRFNGGGSRIQNRKWHKLDSVYVRGLRSDGYLGKVRLVAALDNGVKPVVRLRLRSGKTLRCTYDHEIVTPEGKVHAEKLEPGDLILTHGDNGGRYYDKNGYVLVGGPQERRHEHVIVMEREIGRPLATGEVIHHINGLRDDNRPENLELLDPAEHRRHHAAERRNADGTFGRRDYAHPARYHYPRPGYVRFSIHYDPVVSVEPDGEERVYDLSVEDNAHTYCANGIVVGNTGKSKVAIDLCVDADDRAILVVCPLSVVNVWPREFRRHAGRQVHVEPLVGASVARRAERGREALARCRAVGRPCVLVVNYEAFWRGKLAELVEEVDWDRVILDESHRIKGHGSKASRFAAKIRHRATRRMCLTGTPLANGPLDIYGQYRFLDPGIFGSSYTHFRQRYAVMGGFEGREVVGYPINPTLPDGQQNPHHDPELEEEYNERLSSIAYHVSADVLDLPDEKDEVRTCQIGARARKLYDEITSDMYAVRDDGSEFTADNVLTRILRQQQLTGGAITDDDGETHEVDDAKESVLRDLLEDVPADEPVVVFTRFVHDLDAARRVAGKLDRRYAEISGRAGTATDHALAGDATLRPDVDVAGVQIQSGGVGVDLSRAAIAVYYSLGHSLFEYEQSRSRVNRPGQERPVTYYHLIADNVDIDLKVYRALASKQDVVDYVMGSLKRGEAGDVTADDTEALR